MPNQKTFAPQRRFLQHEGVYIALKRCIATGTPAPDVTTLEEILNEKMDKTLEG